MSELIKVKQQGEERCEGISYQNLLDEETIEVPAYLREDTNPYMGDEDISVDRWISRDFHDKEKEKLWPKVWQMTCREEDIPEVGDHHIYEIIDQSIIVTRTGDDEFKGFINSCLHRGRILRDCDGHADEFVCPFHGATWDINGEFKGIPCKWDFSHLDEKDMSLPQVKVGTWGGFIFINFDNAAAPLGPTLGRYEPFLENFDLADAICPGTFTLENLPWNWKVMFENFNDGYHANRLHQYVQDFCPSDMSAFPVPWDDDSGVIFRTAGYTHIDGGFNATHRVIWMYSRGSLRKNEPVRPSP